MTSPDARQIATRYLDAWNEADPTRRRDLIAALWTEEATYCDPLMQGEGHAGIAGLIQGVQERFPGFRFALDGRVEGHGDRLRFSWTLGPAAGEAVVKGTDFAVLSRDGRLREVTGFIDQAPGM
jgi:hypothetical protein